MSTKDKVPFFVSRCEEMGIDVLPPDVNAVRPRLRGRRGRHPLRPRRRQERRLRGRREDPRGARRRAAPFTSIWDFCARVDCAHREQEGDREPDQVRRARLDRRDAQGHARPCSPQAQASGAEGAGGRAVGPGRRSSTSTTPARRRRRRRARTTRRCRRTSSSASSCSRLEKETLGIFLSSHPLADVRAPAARARRLLARRARRASRTARG